jgi:hypothetical protein
MKNQKEVIQNKEFRNCRVTLVEDELLKKGQSAAEINKKILILEIEKADYNKKIKGRINDLTGELKTILYDISDKKESRSVECVIDYDRQRGKVIYSFRGEIVDERDIAPSDNQKTFVFD